MSPDDLLDETSLPSKKSKSLYDDKFQGDNPDDIDPYEDLQDAAADDVEATPPGDDWSPLHENLQKKDKEAGKKKAKPSDADSQDAEESEDADGSEDDTLDDYAYADEDQKNTSPKNKKASAKKSDDGDEDDDQDDDQDETPNADEGEGEGEDDYAYSDSDNLNKKTSSSDDAADSTADKGGGGNRDDGDGDEGGDGDADADPEKPSPKSATQGKKKDAAAASSAQTDKGGSSSKSKAQSDSKEIASGSSDSPSNKNKADGDSDEADDTYSAAEDEDPSSDYDADSDADVYEDEPTEQPDESSSSKKADNGKDGKKPSQKEDKEQDGKKASQNEAATQSSKKGGDQSDTDGGQDSSYGDDPQDSNKEDKEAEEDKTDNQDYGSDESATNDSTDKDSRDYGDAPSQKTSQQKKNSESSAAKEEDDPFADEPQDDGSAYDPDMVLGKESPFTKDKQDCCASGECAPCGTQDSSVEDDLQDQTEQLEQPAKMYDKLKKTQEEVDGYNKITANPHQIFRDPDLLHTAKNDPDNLDKHFRKIGRNPNSAPPPDPEDMANDPEYMETIRRDNRTAARHVQDLGKQYGISVIEMPLPEMNAHIEALHSQYDPNKEYEDPTQASDSSYRENPYSGSAYGGEDGNTGGNTYGGGDSYGGQKPTYNRSNQYTEEGLERLQQYSDADYADDAIPIQDPQEAAAYGSDPEQELNQSGERGRLSQNYAFGGDTGYLPEDDGYGPGPYGGYNGTHHNEKLAATLKVLSRSDHDIDPLTEGKIRRSILNIQHFQDDPEAFEEEVVRQSDASGTMIAGMRPSEMHSLYYKVKGIARQNQVENNVFIPDPIRPNSGIPYNDKVRAQQRLQEYGYSSYSEENFYGTPYFTPSTNSYGPKYSAARAFYNRDIRDNRYNIEDPYFSPMQRQMEYQGGIGRMSPDPYGPGPAGMGARDGDPYGIGASGMGMYQPTNLQSLYAVQYNAAPRGNKALVLSEMSAFLNDQSQPTGAANTSGDVYGNSGAGTSSDGGEGSDRGGDESTSNGSNWDQFKDDPMGFAINKGIDLATKGLAAIGLTPDDAMQIAGAVTGVMGAVDKVKGTYYKMKNILNFASRAEAMLLSPCAIADAATSGDIVNQVSGVINDAKAVVNDAKTLVNDGKSLISGVMHGDGFKGKLMALVSGVGKMADDVSTASDDLNNVYNHAHGHQRDDQSSAAGGSGGVDDSGGVDSGANDGEGGLASDQSFPGNLALDGQGQFAELSNNSGYAPSVSEDSQTAQIFGEMEY